MLLTKEQKQNILGDFYKIKLSYENIIHKKVSGNHSTFEMDFDYAMIIPKGKKYFAWFIFYNDEPVCLLMEIEHQNKKEIKHIKVVHCCFSYELSYGTVLYGTLFYHNNHPFFSIEYRSVDFSTYRILCINKCSANSFCVHIADYQYIDIGFRCFFSRSHRPKNGGDLNSFGKLSQPLS